MLHTFIYTFIFVAVIATITGCTVSKTAKGSFLEDYFGKVKTIKTITYEGSDTSFLSVESFNLQGKPVKMEYYINNYETPYHVDEFTYTPEGNKATTNKTNSRGNASIKQHLSLGSDNVKKLDKTYKRLHPEIPGKAATMITGTVTERRAIKYKSIHYRDRHNYLLEMHKLDTTGNLVEKTIIENDRKGNHLSRTAYRQDTLVYTIKQTFDAYSNVITYQRSDYLQPPREKQVFRYDYDKYNNWIKKYIVTSKGETLAEVQVIEYSPKQR